MIVEKEDAYREIDGLLDNIEGLKLKLSKERKEKKGLEEEIKALERKIYKELKSVKKHIVGEIETTGHANSQGSRIVHSASYVQERQSPRIELIL